MLGLIGSLKELLEDARDLLRRDAGARVVHFHLNALLYRRDSQIDLAATFGELERVRDQIPKHFVDAIGIPVDGLGQSLLSGAHLEANAALVGEYLERLLEIVQEAPKLGGPHIQLSAAGFEPRDVEQLIDQA